MLSFPTDAVVSKPASQITTELIGPTQPSLAPAGGLGIEGITIRPELDHRENDLETRDCACTDATHKHLQSPEEHNYDLGTTPTVVQDDFPRIQNRQPSSYRKYFALSILSTTLSLAYVVIAIWGPVWGKIRDPAIAKNVASLLAKLVETSFGAICILYLGQLLTRRSTNTDIHHGVSLDQISLRNWIIDPWSMVGDGKVLGIRSLLGWYVLVAAVTTSLYGTASSNLIQPVLRDTPAQRINMRGMVKASFANESYLETSYRSSLVSPHTQKADRNFMIVVYSSRGSDSWNTYLTAWNNFGNRYPGKPSQSQRLAPWTLDKNTQGQTNGSWVQSIDMQEAFNRFGRVVHNVTLAIPHPGILEVARNSSNSIAQPHEFIGGVGRYKLRAQIPSPYLNVLCANIKRADLEGLIWEDQVNGQLESLKDLNVTDPRYFINAFSWDKFALMKTPVDNIFNWNNKNKRPIFYRWPLPQQTILNRTVEPNPYNGYGRDTVYLLGAPASNENKTDKSTMDYSLCSMQAGLLSECHTELTLAGNYSVMVAHCEDKNDSMSYAKRNTSATDTIKPDWIAVGSLAAASIALNSGETGTYAANAIYLTKLILTSASLPSNRPSISEGLAGMLMPSLIMAAQDSPFDMSSLDPLQNFNQSLGYAQEFPAILDPALFASGGEKWYHRLYTIVFVLVFLMNVYMMWYLFFRHRNDLMIDICDPVNMFGLAASSTFGHFPNSDLILSPKKEPRKHPLSTEWKIRSDLNGRMEIAQVSSINETGGSPNDTVRSTGHTPLLVSGRNKRNGAMNESMEMETV